MLKNKTMQLTRHHVFLTTPDAVVADTWLIRVLPGIAAMSEVIVLFLLPPILLICFAALWYCVLRAYLYKQRQQRQQPQFVVQSAAGSAQPLFGMHFVQHPGFSPSHETTSEATALVGQLTPNGLFHVVPTPGMNSAVHAAPIAPLSGEEVKLLRRLINNQPQCPEINVQELCSMYEVISGKVAYDDRAFSEVGADGRPVVIPAETSAKQQPQVKQALPNFTLPLRLQALQIPREAISLMSPLGCGEFGRVMLGRVSSRPSAPVSGPITVAVKTLNDSATMDAYHMFISEADIMVGLRHKHVLELIGICISQTDRMVCLEYAALGDLRTFLRSAFPTNPINSADLTSFARQVASGMTFLGSVSCIHRDLAARNCLLDANWQVKISDFGLSRRIAPWTLRKPDDVGYIDEGLDEEPDYYMVSTQFRLPWRWMAIESLAFRRFSVRSDVWSFGVLLWELHTHCQLRPYDEIGRGQDLLAFLQSGRRLEWPEACNEAVYGVMIRCWNANARDRPAFDRIETELQQL
jgi:hypothetical protein